MSWQEAMAWSEYRALRGSLNLGRRIECSVALLAQMFNNSRGGSAKIMDFCPHEAAQMVGDDEEMLSVMKKMGAKVRRRDK